jgi:hypothetical protein
MDENIKRRFDRLIQCLQLVASDAEEQISVFPDFVDIPDEIALEYDRMLTWLDDYHSEEMITEEQKRRLKQIDDLFTGMSHDKSKSYWDLEALRNLPEWEQARMQARDLLKSLGIQKEYPNLYWLTYIPGKESQ